MVKKPYEWFIYISSLKYACTKSLFTSSIAWKLQRPKLVLWSPSLPMVKRSHCSQCLRIGRRSWTLNLSYTSEKSHQQQNLSWIPICTWLAFSLVEDWLAPMFHSSRENGIPLAWLFSILDIIIIIINMFVDMIQQLDNTSHKIRCLW